MCELRIKYFTLTTLRPPAMSNLSKKKGPRGFKDGFSKAALAPVFVFSKLESDGRDQAILGEQTQKVA